MRVLVSIPNTGWVHKLTCFVSDRLAQDKRVTLIRPTHRPFENNLHHIVADFLEGGYDFWLNIDADNPPVNNPLDLTTLNKDIVGCPTPVWYYDDKTPNDRPFYWNVYDYVSDFDAYKEHQEKSGLQQADAVGTGCILIHRRVFEHPKMQLAPFRRTTDSLGRVDKGNDIAFCERARACGFSVYAHYGYPCHHFVEVDLLEVIERWGK